MSIKDAIKHGCQSAVKTSKLRTVTLYRDQLAECVDETSLEELIGAQSGRSVAVCPRMVLAAMEETASDTEAVDDHG